MFKLCLHRITHPVNLCQFIYTPVLQDPQSMSENVEAQQTMVERGKRGDATHNGGEGKEDCVYSPLNIGFTVPQKHIS